jgi:DNA-binding CsgD family transcriptional regulator
MRTAATWPNARRAGWAELPAEYRVGRVKRFTRPAPGAGVPLRWTGGDVLATAAYSIPKAGAPFTEPVSPSWPGLAAGVLDLVREAVLVLGRDARPLGMNRAARALLLEGDGLALSSRGLVASTPCATAALLRRIERAALGESSRVEVPRAAREPLALRGEPYPEHKSAAAAVVFAVDHGCCALRSPALRARYGLTPTESSVASRLAAGAGLEQIGRELEISINTVRGHLKAIFGKTRTHRQAELVCKLLSEL